MAFDSIQSLCVFVFLSVTDLEVEPRLLVGVEVALAVLLGEQRLELRQGETLPRSSRRPDRLVLPDLAELDPEVVVDGGGHLAVLVGGVAGAEHAVHGALERVRRGADGAPVRQPHQVLRVRRDPPPGRGRGPQLLQPAGHLR